MSTLSSQRLFSSSLSPPPTSPDPTPTPSSSQARIPKSYLTPVRPLPYELTQHINVYLEEGLHSQALSFLSSLLAASAVGVAHLLRGRNGNAHNGTVNRAGESGSGSASKATFVPTTQHLSLISSMIAHPSLTTRKTSPEQRLHSQDAARFLQTLNELVGPVQSCMSEAFAFHSLAYSYGRPRSGGMVRSGSGRKLNSGYDGPTDDKETQSQTKIDSPFANPSGNIYQRAADFWAVLGWALNCSCQPAIAAKGMYAKRWLAWIQWLNVHVAILEDDWEIRFREGQCERSMIWSYVRSQSEHGRYRRIMRALFADGGTKSMNEFREVFKNELKEAKRQDDELDLLKRNREKREKEREQVDVEKEVYGDYAMMEEDEYEVEDEDVTMTNPMDLKPRRSRSRRTASGRVTPKTSNSSLRSEHEDSEAEDGQQINVLGPLESVALRLRIMHLLSHLAGALEKEFMPLDELYTLFVEFIKPLPLQTFQQVVLPLEPVFSADAQSTLLEMILHRLLDSAAPNERKEPYLTQKKMEIYYLPFAANKTSIIDNVKVSILLEALLRLLARTGLLKNRSELANAVETGIAARCNKAGESRRKSKQTNSFKDLLEESGERMRLVLEIL